MVDELRRIVLQVEEQCGHGGEVHVFPALAAKRIQRALVGRQPQRFAAGTFQHVAEVEREVRLAAPARGRVTREEGRQRLPVALVWHLETDGFEDGRHHVDILGEGPSPAARVRERPPGAGRGR